MGRRGGICDALPLPESRRTEWKSDSGLQDPYRCKQLCLFLPDGENLKSVYVNPVVATSLSCLLKAASPPIAAYDSVLCLSR